MSRPMMANQKRYLEIALNKLFLFPSNPLYEKFHNLKTQDTK